MNNDSHEFQSGILHLVKRLQASGIQILKQSRPWPDRHMTLFEIGQADRATDIVLSDEFVSDLINTVPYHTSLDAYARAVGGRLKYGSPEVFYCRSGRGIRVEIAWPTATVVFDGTLRTWLRVDITETEEGQLARCAVQMDNAVFDTEETPFDRVKALVNRIRSAVDAGSIKFYPRKDHPIQNQMLERGSIDPTDLLAASTDLEIQDFLAGKAYFMGFRLSGFPTAVWAADPWDAEYLHVTEKTLLQGAFVLQARGIVKVKPPDAIQAVEKLLIEGWPSALGSSNNAREPQSKASLRALPNKDRLLEDIQGSLNRQAGSAVIVIDLDNFKQVNDTRGHSQGDECLERVVKSISDMLGQKGTLYRWGGDEFAVLLPDYSIEEAEPTANRIRRSIEEMGKDYGVTASVGVSATSNMDSPSNDALLDAADKALYESKNAGRNCVTLWPVETVGERPDGRL